MVLPHPALELRVEPLGLVGLLDIAIVRLVMALGQVEL